MPELPDVTIYLEALERKVGKHQINRIDLRSPFVVRTFEPDLFAAVGSVLHRFRRLGKRIVWALNDELFLVFHLMIAGRFHRKRTGTKPRAKTDLVAFHFDHGKILFPSNLGSVRLIRSPNTCLTKPTKGPTHVASKPIRTSIPRPWLFIFGRRGGLAGLFARWHSCWCDERRVENAFDSSLGAQRANGNAIGMGRASKYSDRRPGNGASSAFR